MTEIEFIKSQGYAVYMRHVADKHCSYTNGVSIGYAQWGQNIHVCTVQA